MGGSECGVLSGLGREECGMVDCVVCGVGCGLFLLVCCCCVDFRRVCLRVV